MRRTSRAVGLGDLEVPVRKQLELQVVVVNVVVVAVAQQDQVRVFGVTEVPPVMNVMCVAPSDLSITTRISAATIAYRNGAEQIRRHTACCPAVAEHGVPGAKDAMDHAIAQQRIGRCRIEVRMVRSPRVRRRVFVGHQLDMRAISGRSTAIVVGIEERAHVHQRISAAALVRSAVVDAVPGGRHPDCGYGSRGSIANPVLRIACSDVKRAGITSSDGLRPNGVGVSLPP
jgi:hypothetical protein